MASSVTHAALPFPVKNARFTISIPYFASDGTPTDPTTPDTERSIDGAGFADCAEEVTTITGSNGTGYLTLTGEEMNCSLLTIAAKVASGPKPTLATIVPRVLPVVSSGTATAGAAGSISLATGSSNYTGCIVKTTGGTGGGGTGGANNQARVIVSQSALVASVSPNWETTPDNTTTYEILVTDLAVGVVAVGGTFLQGKVGPNFDHFFENDGASTIVKVDDVPTSAEIATQVDTTLSGTHGAGAWGGGGSAPTVAQIDAYLTTNHGTGPWGAAAPIISVDEVRVVRGDVLGQGTRENPARKGVLGR